MKGHNPDISVFGNRDDMTVFLVRHWREAAEYAVAQRGLFAAALSGGTTPGDFYRALAEQESLPWGKTHIFLVDERCVPFSDRDSNFGMMQSLLLNRVGIPGENIHAIITSELSPARAAERYELEMKRFFGLAENKLPVFDFICLGIGEDGHTASIFPGVPRGRQPEIGETIRLAVSVEHHNVIHARISLTLPVINNAVNIMFIVTGKNKAAIVKRVVADRDLGFPAGEVEPENGKLQFVLDVDAASMLQ